MMLFTLYFLMASSMVVIDVTSMGAIWRPFPDVRCEYRRYLNVPVAGQEYFVPFVEQVFSKISTEKAKTACDKYHRYPPAVRVKGHPLRQPFTQNTRT